MRRGRGMGSWVLRLAARRGGAIGARKGGPPTARYLTRDPRRRAGAARRELADFLVDQGVDVRPSATPDELRLLVREELGADGRQFAAALAEARSGRPRPARQRRRGHTRSCGSAASDPARTRPHRTSPRSRRAPLSARVNPQVVVIAAGLGTRLRPLTERYAKPVLPIEGKPVIAMLLRELAEAGFDAVTVVIGHLGDQVERLIGDGQRLRARGPLRPTGLARWLGRRRARAPRRWRRPSLSRRQGFMPGDIGRFAAAFAAAAPGERSRSRTGRAPSRSATGSSSACSEKGSRRGAALGCRPALAGHVEARPGEPPYELALRVSACDRRGRACSGDRDRPDARPDGRRSTWCEENFPYLRDLMSEHVRPLPAGPSPPEGRDGRAGDRRAREGEEAASRTRRRSARRSGSRTSGSSAGRRPRPSSGPCSSSRRPTTTPTTRSAARSRSRAATREANGHYKLASSLSPNSEHYAERIMGLDRSERPPAKRGST